jgi:hypothetical protein
LAENLEAELEVGAVNYNNARKESAVGRTVARERPDELTGSQRNVVLGLDSKLR